MTGGRKIALWRPVGVDDGQGGQAIEFALLGYERGRIHPAGSSRRRSGGQDQAVVTHTAHLRARAGVRMGDRLVLDTKIFEVTEVPVLDDRLRNLSVGVLHRQLDDNAKI